MLLFFGSVSNSPLLKDELKLTSSPHGQKNRKGDDEPIPLVDDPDAVNLHPATRDQPSEEVKTRGSPYHQSITNNHVGAIESYVGKVQGDGLVAEVALWGLGSPIEETLLE
jgi:hypothetical protein